MKKLVFMFVAFVAMSFAACGNKTAATVENDSTAVDSVDSIAVVDSIAIDSVTADSVK